MQQRALSAAIFVPPLVIILALGGVWIALLILVAGGFAALEALRLLRSAGYPVLVGLGVAITLAVILDAAARTDLTGSAAILISVAVILAGVGAFAEIRQAGRYPDGRYDLLAAGTGRFVIESVDAGSEPYLVAEVTPLEEEVGDEPRAERLAASAIRRRRSSSLTLSCGGLIRPICGRKSFSSSAANAREHTSD